MFLKKKLSSEEDYTLCKGFVYIENCLEKEGTLSI